MGYFRICRRTFQGRLFSIDGLDPRNQVSAREALTTPLTQLYRHFVALFEFNYRRFTRTILTLDACHVKACAIPPFRFGDIYPVNNHAAVGLAGARRGFLEVADEQT